MSDLLVSVIVVFRNEERYLVRCIESVISQFVDHSRWELILVDGKSFDRSVELVTGLLRNTKISFRLLDNPERTLAAGWNIGLKAAKGKYAIRPDAHAVLKSGYIPKAVETIEKMKDVAVVGGVLETLSDSFSGKMIKEALSMRSGVGNSSFRTGESSGYKDTAVYGLYRMNIFEKVGYFNEKLVRHQDTEMHHRILKNGYKIYMRNDIVASYYCRDSFKAIGKQMYDIGYYFSFLISEGAGNSMRLRHWVPLIFYVLLGAFLIGGFIANQLMYLFCVVSGLYLSVILLESLFRCVRSQSLFPIFAILIIPFMHISYAFGTLTGLLRLLLKSSS
jgi:glycosyltransferase involved in cell wall biosynthesis